MQNSNSKAELIEFEQLAIEQNHFEQIEKDLLKQNITEYRKFIDNRILKRNKLSDYDIWFSSSALKKTLTGLKFGEGGIRTLEADYST